MTRPLATAMTVMVSSSLILLGGAVAVAGGRPLSTDMTGAQEVPGPGDPDGSGTAQLRLNVGQATICFRLEVHDIAPANGAHVQVGEADEVGPIVVVLTPPTSGASEGCVTADRDLIKAIIQRPDQYYVNVRNTDFFAGAVRGQLSR